MNKNVTLYLSLILFELGIIMLFFASFRISLIFAVIGIVFYSVWLINGEIREYHISNNPFKHMKQTFFYRRSARIKVLTTALLFAIILLQISFTGFVYDNIGFYFPSIMGISSIFIFIFYLVEDLRR
jgi:hypothetical protein